MRSGSLVDDQGKLNNFAIEPQMYVAENAGMGFNDKAEKLNGRLAMIGFVSLLVFEAVTGHGIIGFLTSL